MEILIPLALIAGFAAGFIVGRLSAKPEAAAEDQMASPNSDGPPPIRPRSDGPPPGRPR